PCRCPATATTETSTLSLHDALPIYEHEADRQVPPVLPGQLPRLTPRGREVDPSLFCHVYSFIFRERVLPRHGEAGPNRDDAQRRDRKSTRLNSSHVKISYAVFCLKK